MTPGARPAPRGPARPLRLSRPSGPQSCMLACRRCLSSAYHPSSTHPTDPMHLDALCLCCRFGASPARPHRHLREEAHR
eukprot:3551779-Pyramimonas_sp.AAC.2